MPRTVCEDKTILPEAIRSADMTVENMKSRLPTDPPIDNPGAVPDWSDAGAYRFTDPLTLSQWVWEFLRRNDDYRRDWLVFQARWEALEAAYGRPPERDFQAWRQDRRAWVIAGENEGECRVDQDRVLIECWMGAKWGFHKFPLDPAIDNPVSPEQLTWREVQQPVRPATPADCDTARASPARAAVAFDLDLPLRQQIERVQRFLVSRQRRLLREGRLQMRTRSALAPRWRLMLRYLDALRSGARGDRIEALLNPGGAVEDFERLCDEARRLASGEHGELLLVIDE